VKPIRGRIIAKKTKRVIHAFRKNILFFIS